jgi:hypothetical protein
MGDKVTKMRAARWRRSFRVQGGDIADEILAFGGYGTR